MILVDYSQIMIANIMMSLNNKNDPLTKLDENIIRHMLLNALRAFRVKFKEEYGELILACDHTNVWRKKFFPYYKANRKKTADSKIDWNDLYRILGKIREEVRDNFPYKVIHIETAEGDDVIGTLVHKFGTDLNIGSEKILIISTDKDYMQLHKYANVYQYDPVFTKKMITCKDPDKFLKEHIIYGDSGDGVPNIMSEDDCLVVGKRQRRITEGRLESYMKKDNKDEVNWHRNKMMIDLSCTPKDLQERILNKYEEEPIGNRENLLNYFMKNKLKLLTNSIGDF